MKTDTLTISLTPGIKQEAKEAIKEKTGLGISAYIEMHLRELIRKNDTGANTKEPYIGY